MASEYTFPAQYRGDTHDGTTFTVNVNGSPYDLTNVTITAKFRKDSKTGPELLSVTNGAGITVSNAAGGIFDLDPFIVDFPPGTHYYDIQFVQADGVVKTYIKGTMTVEQDVTN